MLGAPVADKGKSAFPPTHCTEIGVMGSIPTHGQLAVPWVYLCDLSCAVKISSSCSVWCCDLWDFDEDL